MQSRKSLQRNCFSYNNIMNCYSRQSQYISDTIKLLDQLTMQELFKSFLSSFQYMNNSNTENLSEIIKCKQFCNNSSQKQINLQQKTNKKQNNKITYGSTKKSDGIKMSAFENSFRSKLKRITFKYQENLQALQTDQKMEEQSFEQIAKLAALTEITIKQKQANNQKYVEQKQKQKQTFKEQDQVDNQENISLSKTQKKSSQNQNRLSFSGYTNMSSVSISRSRYQKNPLLDAPRKTKTNLKINKLKEQPELSQQNKKQIYAKNQVEHNNQNAIRRQIIF